MQCLVGRTRKTTARGYRCHAWIDFGAHSLDKDTMAKGYTLLVSGTVHCSLASTVQ